jgi:hypothetical protein
MEGARSRSGLIKFIGEEFDNCQDLVEGKPIYLTKRGTWLGGAALALGVHRLSFVPGGRASSFSLL